MRSMILDIESSSKNIPKQKLDQHWLKNPFNLMLIALWLLQHHFWVATAVVALFCLHAGCRIALSFSPLISCLSFHEQHSELFLTLLSRLCVDDAWYALTISIGRHEPPLIEVVVDHDIPLPWECTFESLVALTFCKKCAILYWEKQRSFPLIRDWKSLVNQG